MAVVEWGDVAEPVFGPDALRVLLAPGESDDERCVTIQASRGVGTPGAPGSSTSWRTGRRHDGAGRGVGHRAGGGGPGRRVRRPRPRRRCRVGRHHAESMAPAIEFVCRRAGVRLGRARRRRRGHRARPLHRSPGGGGHSQSVGVRVGRPPRRGAQPRDPGPRRGDLGRSRRHPRGPRRRRPARRGLRGPPARRRRSGVVGAETRRAPIPRGPGRRVASALATRSWWRGTAPRRYRSVLGVRARRRRGGGGARLPVPGCVWPRWRWPESAAGLVDDGAEVLPQYLRDAETRIKWETRAGRAGAGT